VSVVRVWYSSQCVLSSVGDEGVPRSTSPLSLNLIDHKRRSVVGLEGFKTLTYGLGNHSSTVHPVRNHDISGG